ncbi:MAG: DNA polymerase IV [Actinomycetota bacterium]
MSTSRSILHVDMDAFFVSVELLRRPDLAGLPVVVGGTAGRGVVAAASYEARRFGVHSAMSSSQARRLCPQAVFLPANHSLYQEVSHQLHDIFLSFTPLIEPISVDESFLDVTGSEKLLGSAVDLAWRIRARVQDELGLACSVGLARNKFLAKLASDFAKPHATAQGIEPGHQVYCVAVDAELEFLYPLPVRALWGVGPVTLKKLESIGIRTVGDLAALHESDLQAAVGMSHGSHLFALGRADDDRPVEPDRVAKSIGHEETFSVDLVTAQEMRDEIVRLSEAVARRGRRAGVAAGTVLLKVKFSDFQTITRSVTPRSPITTAPAFVAALLPLLAKIDATQGVRLLGVHAQKLGEASTSARMFVEEDDSVEEVEHLWSATNEAIDEIVSRYGREAIRPASALADRKAPGDSPYGPDELV